MLKSYNYLELKMPVKCDKAFAIATWFPSYIGFIANYPIKNVIMIDDSYQNPCTQNNSQTSFLRTRSMTIDSG